MAISANLNFEYIVSHKNATSYISLERANSYFLQRPNSTLWTAATDDEKAVALIQATRAIEAYPGMASQKFKNFDDDQALYFPLFDVNTIQGSVNSATSTTLTSADLEDVNGMPDDFWNYGSVKIIDGTGQFQIYEISDFASATGTITINGTWATTPDTTSEFELIGKIPEEILRACCEIAYLYVPDDNDVINDTSSRTDLQAQGVTSFRIGDHSENFNGAKEINGYYIPARAVAILNKFATWFC